MLLAEVANLFDLWQGEDLSQRIVGIIEDNCLKQSFFNSMFHKFK
jgi:hypothetical protein